MASATKRKSQQKHNTTPTERPVSNDEEIPEHIRKVKEKLEKKTGKKYRYQPGKKDMPSVPDLLKYGAPGAKPPTFREKVKTAVMFAALFALTLFVYHHAVLTRPSKRQPYKLPPQKRAESAARMKESIGKVDPMTVPVESKTAKESETVVSKDKTDEAAAEL